MENNRKLESSTESNENVYDGNYLRFKISRFNLLMKIIHTLPSGDIVIEKGFLYTYYSELYIKCDITRLISENVTIYFRLDKATSKDLKNLATNDDVYLYDYKDYYLIKGEGNQSKKLYKYKNIYDKIMKISYVEKDQFKNLTSITRPLYISDPKSFRQNVAKKKYYDLFVENNNIIAIVPESGFNYVISDKKDLDDDFFDYILRVFNFLNTDYRNIQMTLLNVPKGRKFYLATSYEKAYKVYIGTIEEAYESRLNNWKNNLPVST